jgi:hypothetical protein
MPGRVAALGIAAFSMWRHRVRWVWQVLGVEHVGMTPMACCGVCQTRGGRWVCGWAGTVSGLGRDVAVRAVLDIGRDMAVIGPCSMLSVWGCRS